MHIVNKHIKNLALPTVIKYAVAAYVLPFACAFGLPVPYLLSFLIAAPLHYAPLILAFSFVGLMFGFNPLSLIDYVLAFLFVVVRIFCDKKKRNLSPAGLSFLCAALVLIPLLTVMPFDYVDAAAFALNRIFGIFVACLACNCNPNALTKPYANKLIRILPLVLLLSSAVNIRLFGISVGYVAAVIAGLHIARFNDPAKSAYLNLLVLVALCLPNLDFKIPVFVFAASSLVSFLSPSTPVRQPLYVTCISVIFGALNVNSYDCVAFVAGTFIASVLFLVTLDTLEKIAVPMILSFFPTVYIKPHSTVIPPTENTLHFLNNQNIAFPPIPMRSEIVVNKICRNCKNYKECILTDCVDMTPLDFDRSCTAVEQCLPNCHKKIGIERFLQQTDKRFDYLRVRCDKVKSNLDVIATLSQTEYPKNDKTIDANLSSEFKNRWSRIVGFDADVLIYDDLSCVFARKKSSESRDSSALETLLLITGTRYKVTKHITDSNFVYTYACPVPDYATSYCLQTVARDNKLPSGDVFDSFSVGNVTYFILCDGMGTGVEARVCAETILEYIKYSLIQGLNVTVALETAGSLMRLTAVDESFAAVDVLKVDLNNGSAVLYKAGGAPSYVLKNDFSVLPQDGFPIGVLSEVSATEMPIDLSCGGEVILSSDGAEIDSDKLEFALLNSDSPDSLCNILVGHNGESVSHYDDACVAVVSVYPKNGKKPL